METLTPEIIIEESNTALIPADEAGKLRASFELYTTKGREYSTYAAALVLTTQDEANANAQMIAKMKTDSAEADAAVNMRRTLFHRLHKNLCAIGKTMTDPIDKAAEIARKKGLAWNAEQKRLADELAAKINRENEERAKKEAEALEAKAATMKTPAKQEEYMERAASVVPPPQVYVPAPKTAGLSGRKHWVATVVDPDAFFRAVVETPMLQGYVTINTGAIASAKISNKLLEIPGIKIEQEVR